MGKKDKAQKVVLVKATVASAVLRDATDFYPYHDAESDTVAIQIQGLPLDIQRGVRKAISLGHPMTIAIQGGKRLAEQRRQEIYLADKARRKELEDKARLAKAEREKVNAENEFWNTVEALNAKIEDETDSFIKSLLIAGIPDMPGEIKTRKANKITEAKTNNGEKKVTKAQLIRDAMPGTIATIVSKSGLSLKDVRHYLNEYIPANRFKGPLPLTETGIYSH